MAAAYALAQDCQGVDLPRSVDYWRQATHADPADAAAAYGLGYGLIPLGDSEGARQAFEQSRRNAEAANDPRGVAVAWLGFGDVLVKQGDGPGALAAYQAGLRIREDLAKRDPANTEWQRDLSVSHERMGDVLVKQGDGPGALAAYQAGLRIAEDLAKRDPANTEWQVDVAVSCAKLGSLSSLLSAEQRKGHLLRGLEILAQLKHAGKLHANQDFSAWFEQALRDLT